MFIIEQLYTIS